MVERQDAEERAEPDSADLAVRSKEGRVSAGELREVAGILADGRGGAETCRLLYVLGRSCPYAHEDLVAGFLKYRQDPMVARLALQILCRFWGGQGPSEPAGRNDSRPNASRRILRAEHPSCASA